jgi:hypothetical protein
MENIANTFEGSNKPNKVQEPTWVPRWEYSAIIGIRNPIFSSTGNMKAVVRLVGNPKPHDVLLSENIDFLPRKSDSKQ